MHDLGLPGWLLKIIASYLSGRTLVVRYEMNEWWLSSRNSPRNYLLLNSDE